MMDELCFYIITDDVKKIIDYNLKGEGHHEAYNRLALLGDKFGPRLSGSSALERAIG